MNDSSPRRSGWPLWLGLALLVTAAAVTAVVLGPRAFQQIKEQREQSSRLLEEFQGEAIAETEAMMAADDPVSGATDRWDKMQGRMSEVAEQLPEQERTVFQASQKAMEQVKPELQNYEAAYTALFEAGAHAPEGLDSVAAVQARRQLVRKFEQANQRLAKEFAALPEAFRAELEARGLARRAVSEAVRGFEQGANLDLVAKIRECDDKLSKKMAATLDVLQRELGNWQLTAAGELEFENDAALETFNRLQEEILEIADDQTKLQQQIVENQRKL